MRLRPFLIVLFLFCFLTSTFAQSNAPVYDRNEPEQIARVTQPAMIRYADEQLAVIAWTTSEPTETRVFYGTDPNNLTQIAEELQASTAHRASLAGLQPGNTYYFQIEGTPQVLTFQTPRPGDNPLRDARPAAYTPAARPNVGRRANSNNIAITAGPMIQYADDRSAVITWTTNAAAPTALSYGTSTSNLGQSAYGDTNTTFHRVALDRLAPATTYFFSIDTGAPQPTVLSFRTAASANEPIYNRAATPVRASAQAANATEPQLAQRGQLPSYQGGPIIPAGTDIEARLDRALSSKTAQQGDEFDALLVNGLKDTQGRDVVPAGSRIHGEISGVEQGKTIPALRGKARLNLRFRELVLPNGQSYPIEASLVSVNQKAGAQTNEEGQVSDRTTTKETAKDIGIGAGLGTVAGLIFGSALKGLAIGAIAGGGYVLATQGRDVNIPADAGLLIRLDQAINLPPASAANRQ